jgi:hypothetical protein
VYTVAPSFESGGTGSCRGKSTFHVFRRGTRVRIWHDTPGTTGDYNFAYNPPRDNPVPAVLKHWHDSDHPSKFVMSVLPDEAVPRPAHPCGQVVAQPCRPDPLADATATR